MGIHCEKSSKRKPYQQYQRHSREIEREREKNISGIQIQNWFDVFGWLFSFLNSFFNVCNFCVCQNSASSSSMIGTSSEKKPIWIWNNKRVSGVCLGERDARKEKQNDHIGNSPNLKGNKIYYAWTASTTFSGDEQFNQEMNNLNFDNQFHFDQTEWIDM